MNTQILLDKASFVLKEVIPCFIWFESLCLDQNWMTTASFSISYLYGHALWLNNMDFVPVSAPHMFIGYHSHTADRMVRFSQIQKVIILQVPQTLCKESAWLKNFLAMLDNSYKEFDWKTFITVSSIHENSTCVPMENGNCSIS
jgi:hypothetical protein